MDGFCASVQSYRTMKFHVIEDPKLALCFRGIQLLVVLRAARPEQNPRPALYGAHA